MICTNISQRQIGSEGRNEINVEKFKYILYVLDFKPINKVFIRKSKHKSL